MQISVEHVKRIAALAKLEITPAELLAMKDQLQKLLDFTGSTDILHREGVEPIGAFPPSLGEVGHCGLSQEEVIALAPDSYQGMIRVPRVVGDE